MSAPVLIVVKRWRCPHCGRSRSKQAAAQAHVDRCWWNHDNQTCKTCMYFRESGCCGRPDTYQCYTPMCDTGPTREAGVEFTADTALPVVGCPSWRSRDDDWTPPASQPTNGAAA